MQGKVMVMMVLAILSWFSVIGMVTSAKRLAHSTVGIYALRAYAAQPH